MDKFKFAGVLLQNLKLVVLLLGLVLLLETNASLKQIVLFETLSSLKQLLLLKTFLSLKQLQIVTALNWLEHCSSGLTARLMLK